MLVAGGRETHVAADVGCRAAHVAEADRSFRAGLDALAGGGIAVPAVSVAVARDTLALERVADLAGAAVGGTFLFRFRLCAARHGGGETARRTPDQGSDELPP